MNAIDWFVLLAHVAVGLSAALWCYVLFNLVSDIFSNDRRR